MGQAPHSPLTPKRHFPCIAAIWKPPCPLNRPDPLVSRSPCFCSCVRMRFQHSLPATRTARPHGSILSSCLCQDRLLSGLCLSLSTTPRPPPGKKLCPGHHRISSSLLEAGVTAPSLLNVTCCAEGTASVIGKLRVKYCLQEFGKVGQGLPQVCMFR